MQHLSRREFLKGAAVAVGATQLSALGLLAATQKGKVKITDIRVMILEGPRTYTLLKVLTDACTTCPQKNQLHLFIYTKMIAISSLKGRASQNAIFRCVEALLDPLTQSLEPRLPVFVSQWNAVFHLLDIGS